MIASSKYLLDYCASRKCVNGLEDCDHCMYLKGRADAIKEVSKEMYHQCFECDNNENMQKWDSGNWFRYKLFENVIEKLKEQKNDK